MAEGDALPKPSTKRKPPKVEESCSKKEHVNVVFIGHVGESRELTFLNIHVLNLSSNRRRWKIHNWRSNHVANGNGR